MPVQHPPKSGYKDKLPLLISVTVLAALVAGYFLWPAYHDFLKNSFKILTSDNEQRIEAWVDQFGWLGPLVLILAMVLQMFLVVINAVALVVVCVLAYGPVWGALVALAGIFTASTVGYLIGRKLSQNAVERMVGAGTYRKMQDFIERYGFWAVVIVRLSPFLSNDAISFIAGLTRMNYLRFILATFLGILPLIIFIAWLSVDIDRLETGLIWVSAVTLAGFILYIWLDRRKRKKRHLA